MIEKTNPVEYLYVKALIKKLIKSKNVYNIFPESGIIFIHIPKTGGLSIKNLLVNLKDDTISNKDKKKYYYLEELKRKKISSIHGKAKDILELLDEDMIKKSLKFSAIRNPWALMVSSYHWWLQNGYKFPRIKHMYLDIKKKTFKEYLMSTYGTKMINECVGNIEDWVKDDNKKIILDGLIRLENFDEEFKNLIKKKNKNIIGLKPIKKINFSNHEKYANYYDSQCIEIIEKRFDFIIRNYGYKF